MENSIEKFIHIEEEHLVGFECKAPQVLVEIDMENGFPKEIEVIWEAGYFLQKLDYWWVPFRCHKCWETGHSKDQSGSVEPRLARIWALRLLL